LHFQFSIFFSGAKWLTPVILATQGGRDQEDHGLKPARANGSVRPYLRKTFYKNRAGGVAQGEDPEFKLQYHKKKKSPQNQSAFQFHKT
jgi:hypothetical protein